VSPLLTTSELTQVNKKSIFNCVPTTS